MTITEEFLKCRRVYIENCFTRLNPMQRSAVLNTEGPLLILAGAGSGKTTVLVNRISNLIRFGNAYSSDYLLRQPTQADLDALKAAVLAGADIPDSLWPLMHAGDVEPWNILAITFTNKAASELKSRIALSAGDAGTDVFASTFHSACVRFLRRDAERLGFPRSFTIYDSDDSVRVIRDILKEESIDDKIFSPKWVQGHISHFKDQMLAPADVKVSPGDPRGAVAAKVYAKYQNRLLNAGAMDFDDLIFNTVRLLSDNADIADYYHRRFRYIMVDEYQDTSVAQYRLVSLLTGDHRNICVVGDDDQSIYRFRGATIENILSFEEHFEGASVIRLEQNYRSTSRILDAANEVISHNKGRKGKKLWTDSGDGDLITVYCADNETEEAAYVGREVLKNMDLGIPLSQQAVLYRMNAQSNAIENYMQRSGIPYRVVGGIRFFDRAEVKDIISYMCIVENPSDDLRLQRIINRPARKIGDSTVAAIASIAEGLGVSMLEVIRNCEEYPALSRARNALKDFIDIYDKLCEAEQELSPGDFAEKLLDISGYRRMLIDQHEEGITRLENVQELVSSVRSYMIENPDGDLSGFLEEAALVSAIDTYDENDDAVVLMTLHSAKGLEFDVVYIVGMEEGIFPGETARYMTDELEEERRLAYVGITRARKKLYLTRAEMRMLFGSTRRRDPSRFIDEFSPELKDEQNVRRRPGYLTGAPVGGSPAQREYRAANTIASDYIETGKWNSYKKASSNEMSRPKPSFDSGSSIVRDNSKKQSSSREYAVGDRVNHKVFGNGTVLSARPMSGDILLEIQFDSAGVKKAMANYAPMEKINE